jgi:hypothetical protein
MTIRKIGTKNTSLGGSRELATDLSAGTRKTWMVTNYVLGDSINNTTDDILSAAGLPLLRSFLDNGYCISKEAREINAAAYLWEVDCTYDSHVDAETPVVEYSWDIEEREEVLRFDMLTGKPILNSVGEPLLTSAPVPIPTLTVTRFEPTFNASIILLYNGRVNSDYFLGAPPYCALMTGPSGKTALLNAQRVWQVTYKIKFNLKIDPQTLIMAGWRLFLLDQGTRYIKATSGTTKEYTNFVADGDNTTGNLNGNGYPLADGAPEVYLNYNRFQMAAFAPLGLV